MYSKDSSVDSGSDCVWVDNVSYSGGAAQYELGDVDMDGRVTIADATIIMRRALGLAALTPEQEGLADIDGDNGINASDALLAMRMAMRIS